MHSSVAELPALEGGPEGAVPTSRMARLRRLFTPANGELFLELLRAAIKTADHNSLLGALWSLLAPFVMLVALYVVFRQRFGGQVAAYPLYLLIGISLVNYFVTATRFLITVAHANRELLLDSTAPRETVFASQLAVHTEKLLIEVAIFAGFSAWYGLLTPLAILEALPLVVAFTALTAGIGLSLTLVYCFARDIEHIWSLVSRLLLFVTPVFYAVDDLSPGSRFVVLWLNPLTPFLVTMRQAFMNEPISVGIYLWALLVGSLALAVGYGAFLVLENAAVERV